MIQPVKTIRKVLPKEYMDLATGVLSSYFPSTFAIDLNGRTLPWEAVVLIPFADEDLFLEEESKVIDEGRRFTEVEKKRNTIYFTYPSFALMKQGQPKSFLKSELTHMKDLQ